MNALAQATPPVPQIAAVPLLRTLVLCDLVESTALIERLGDQRAAELFRKHDRLARALLGLHAGREIDKTDGFLLLFDRPVQAVAFALDYQRTLKQLSMDEQVPLAARVGIHVGDVLTWDNAPDDVAKGAKLVEVEGLVKPIASRLMQLALPKQILLSGVAYALAHRAQGELGLQLDSVRWRTHGRYRFKGIPDPIPVFEVGDEGIAPLRPPPWSGKAHRETPFWRRPAALLFEGVLLLIALAIPGWYLLKPEPAIAFANRDWVVVGDLKNLTGDARFDESVDTAFRIGLEQSRYVNVLSELKTHQTLALMQKDPEKTAIDRTTGAEVALRDGARALILPTIAEIGGRVRVTAEVIDPSSQTTVYSESADGVGAGSVLQSLDKLNQKLRVRLGEALASVSKDSRPLESVTTSSLDALKAYTLGERVYATGDMDEAQTLYTQALKVDPSFALAHIALARVAINEVHTADAQRQMSAALALPDRLTPKDKLYAEAMQATFNDPQLALQKLRLLTTLYPGRYEGIYGYFAWQDENNFDAAVVALEKSVTPQNPYRATSEYVLGALYLGLERYADAARAFDDAKAAGLRHASEFHASVYAAQRDYAKADVLLAETASDAGAGLSIALVSTQLDQSQWNKARALIAAAAKGAPDEPVPDIDASIATALGSASFAIERKGAGTDAASNAPRDMQAQFRTLMRAYAAARSGKITGSRRLIDSVGNAASLSRASPLVLNMRAVAASELLRVSGNPHQAIAQLRQLISGNELLITHVALMDAYDSAGDRAAALQEARLLSSRRGRAYAEYNMDRLLTPFNVIESNLALLRAAELLDALGKPKEAADQLAAFRKIWKDSDAIPALARRTAKLTAR